MAARAILHSGSYMLHGQHLSSPGADVLSRWEESTPNFSLRMSALAAALLRPQLAELPQRAARWNAIHRRICLGLARSQNVRLPQRSPDEDFSATSVQFSTVGLETADMNVFLGRAKSRGVPVKWFGAERQAGFTSAPRHWAYAGEQGSLEATHRVLSNLCDIRTPVSMTDDECDLAAKIVCEALDEAVFAASERAKADRVRCPEPANQKPGGRET
jgi:dTDP-4-amino-4,6-dideoxygalactose transaminase